LILRRSAVLAVVALPVLAAAARAEPFTIEATGSETGRGKVRAIGDFHPERDPTLRAAIRAFGQPDTRAGSGQGSACRVLWRPEGLRIQFVNLGAPGRSACDPAIGRSQNARAFDPRWRTGRGLRIGHRLRRLRRLYPGATRHGRSWSLVKGINVFVGDHPYPVLRATMRDGRVASFALSIGAAGE
jgi:hypothetical protein